MQPYNNILVKSTNEVLLCNYVSLYHFIVCFTVYCWYWLFVLFVEVIGSIDDAEVIDNIVVVEVIGSIVISIVDDIILFDDDITVDIGVQAISII